MAICKDKRTKKFYISYRIKVGEDKYKRRAIYNKDRDYNVGIKYMRLIELEEIEKDKAIFDKNYHKEDEKLSDLIKRFIREQSYEVKSNTIDNKIRVINNYVLKFFDNNQNCCDTLIPRNATKLKNYVVNQDWTATQKNSILLCARSIIDFAYNDDLINDESRKKCVKALANCKGTKKLKNEFVCWTPEEFETFINSFDDNDKRKLLFLTTYWCALRIGECIGLKFKDFDFEHKTLTVNRQINRQGCEDTLKTEDSNGTISLNSKLSDMLEKYKSDNYYIDDDYLFFGTKHTSRTEINRIYKRHIEMSGVRYVKFHGLRDALATRMIYAGVNVIAVSKQLRHSNPNVTLQSYAKFWDTMNKSIIDKI